MTDAVTVTVPATTANLGPGFDCLGAALTLYNRFRFSRLSLTEPALKITATGSEADSVNYDETNLAYRAFVRLYEKIGQPIPSISIEIDLGVPLARGLGSSATAIVGGLLGANQLAGEPLSQEEVIALAIAIEGHPDNVVPALKGGCSLTVESDKGTEICDIPWHQDIIPILAIPAFELSTTEARKVLPLEYSRADAIFNAAHLGLLLRAVETGNGDWLRVAMEDRIHQPYRTTLIPGYEAVRSAAKAAGAYGTVISGAGPTLLALSEPARKADVAVAIATAWQQEGIQAEVKVLQVDSQGAFSDRAI